jgi:acyl carrier protein
MKDELLQGIAEILEVPAVSETTVLAEAGNWDSLAIVCTIALIDEKAGGAPVSGQALMACVTAGDVLRLAGVREAQTVEAADVGDLADIFGAGDPRAPGGES